MRHALVLTLASFLVSELLYIAFLLATWCALHSPAYRFWFTLWVRGGEVSGAAAYLGIALFFVPKPRIPSTSFSTLRVAGMVGGVLGSACRATINVRPVSRWIHEWGLELISACAILVWCCYVNRIFSRTDMRAARLTVPAILAGCAILFGQFIQTAYGDLVLSFENRVLYLTQVNRFVSGVSWATILLTVALWARAASKLSTLRPGSHAN